MSRILASGVAITFALLLTPAHAQMPSPVSYAGMDHLARIVAGTPGLPGYMVSGVNDGVTLRTTGNVLVGNASGVRIPVPVVAQATISKAAMAKAAAKFVARSTLIGAPFLAYDTYKFLKDEALLPTCAHNAALFCTPATSATPNPSYFGTPDGVRHTTGQIACELYGAKSYPNTATFLPWKFENFDGTYGRCKAANGSYYFNVGYGPKVCGDGAAPVNGTCTATPGREMTEAEVITAATGTNWDPLRSKKMHDALVADQARSPGVVTNEDLKPAASPLVWEGSPASSPGTVTKTETVPNADGSTSTKRTTETTTVTPVVPATSTIGAPAVPEFKMATTSVVNTTNNTTNVTTTESTTTTNYAPAQPAAEPAKLEIPDDYAREPTLKAIEKELTAAEAEEMPDQDKIVTDAKKANEDGLKTLHDAAIAAQSTDKNVFFSWVWTPPVGTCQTTSRVISSGHTIGFDICPAVSNIREFFAWFLALFTCWSVYNTIFKIRED